MTSVRNFVKGTAAGVCIADRPEDLSALKNRDCAAVIWRRQPLPGFQSWIDSLQPELLPKARVIVRPEAVRETATQICEMSGTPACKERVRLVDDVAALADIIMALTPAPYVRLRFDVVTTNACWKFHVDAITARLICTYRGAGTQYGTSSNGSAPQTVHDVPTGAPILLRGTLWPTHPKSGLLHRSPPIEGTGESRLVLVIDPISETDIERQIDQTGTFH